MLGRTLGRPAAVSRPGPYARAAAGYRQLSWPDPIPVRGKFPPVTGYTGYTGYTGASVTDTDVARWSTGAEGHWNIALRLPGGVVGIDVDHYDDKHGADTLAKATAELGDLPATWSISARGADQPSRIHLFRVPVDSDWSSAQAILRSRFGNDIDVIWCNWRYAVAAPSTHPASGKLYAWYNPQGSANGKAPGRMTSPSYLARGSRHSPTPTAPGSPRRRKGPGRPGETGGFDLEAFIQRHPRCSRSTQERPWPGGGRRWVLNVCPVNPDHTDRSAFIGRRGDGVIVAACLHKSCTWDWQQLRALLEIMADEPQGEPAAAGLLTIQAAGTRPEGDRPLPLVDGLLTQGELLVLGAGRGIGKTWWGMDLAHQLARGQGKVMGTYTVRRAVRVLYCHGELDP